jgi:hypothetical protein
MQIVKPNAPATVNSIWALLNKVVIASMGVMSSEFALSTSPTVIIYAGLYNWPLQLRLHFNYLHCRRRQAQRSTNDHKRQHAIIRYVNNQAIGVIDS